MTASVRRADSLGLLQPQIHARPREYVQKSCSVIRVCAGRPVGPTICRPPGYEPLTRKKVALHECRVFKIAFAWQTPCLGMLPVLENLRVHLSDTAIEMEDVDYAAVQSHFSLLELNSCYIVSFSL